MEGQSDGLRLHFILHQQQCCRTGWINGSDTGQRSWIKGQAVHENRNYPAGGTRFRCYFIVSILTICTILLETGVSRTETKKLSCCYDSRSYCVRRAVYIGKQLNRFQLQVYERLVRSIRFNG